MLSVVAPLLLAGVFPLHEPQDAAWGTAGAWFYPVGARRMLGASDAPECPAFRLNRGLEQRGTRLTHEGADLANGRAGDTVRAAASGLVVLEGSRDDGYGHRIVLAHRLPAGALAYTVYAHLAEGTAIVKPGDRVCAGDPLARVGQTGRATTPHLHFEVRAVDDPAQRWENSRVVDPIAFLAANLPKAIESEPGVAPYLEWAQCEGLVEPNAFAEGVLTYGTWWHMLNAAASLPRAPVPESDEALRDSLITAGVLAQEAGEERPDGTVTWRSCARDLARLADIGVRMPHGPLVEAAHQALCRQRFDREAPADEPATLRKRHGVPRTADACVLLADLSGPRHEDELPVARRGGHGRTKPHHKGTHHRHHKPKRQSLRPRKRPTRRR